MTFDDFDFNFDMDAMQSDLDRVEKKPGQVDTSYKKKYVLMPKGEGSLSIRILPADTPKGRKLPYASTRLHYLNGRSYHCLRESQGGSWRGDCPICTYYYALYQMAKEAKSIDAAKQIEDIAKSFKPIERYYYNVIVRKEIDSETKEVVHNVGPKIWSAGKSLHGRILRAFLGNKKLDEAPLGNIANPFTGRDFKIIKEIRKSGGKEYPNYDQSKFEGESVLGDKDQIKNWLENLWDLEAERTNELKTYEELQHQIDIVQGKVQDDSLGYNIEDFTLPAEAGVDSSDRVVMPEVKPQVKPSVTNSDNATSQKSESSSDIPFDLDLNDMPGIDGVEPDWVKDLQEKVNAD